MMRRKNVGQPVPALAGVLGRKGDWVHRSLRVLGCRRPWCAGRGAAYIRTRRQHNPPGRSSDPEAARRAADRAVITFAADGSHDRSADPRRPEARRRALRLRALEGPPRGPAPARRAVRPDGHLAPPGTGQGPGRGRAQRHRGAARRARRLRGRARQRRHDRLLGGRRRLAGPRAGAAPHLRRVLSASSRRSTAAAPFLADPIVDRGRARRRPRAGRRPRRRRRSPGPTTRPRPG